MPVLTRLPTEIRLKVLRYAINEEIAIEGKSALPPHEVYCYGCACRNPALPLLLACKQLNADISTMTSTIAILKFADLVTENACMIACSPMLLRYIDRYSVKQRRIRGFDVKLTQAHKASYEESERRIAGFVGMSLEKRFSEVMEQEHELTWSEKERSASGKCLTTPFLLTSPTSLAQ